MQINDDTSMTGNHMLIAATSGFLTIKPWRMGFLWESPVWYKWCGITGSGGVRTVTRFSAIIGRQAWWSAWLTGN